MENDLGCWAIRLLPCATGYYSRQPAASAARTATLSSAPRSLYVPSPSLRACVERLNFAGEWG